jgi:hypothetical protein
MAYYEIAVSYPWCGDWRGTDLVRRRYALGVAATDGSSRRSEPRSAFNMDASYLLSSLSSLFFSFLLFQLSTVDCQPLERRIALPRLNPGIPV